MPVMNVVNSEEVVVAVVMAAVEAAEHLACSGTKCTPNWRNSSVTRLSLKSC